MGFVNQPLTNEAARKLMALDMQDKEILTCEKLDEWYTAWGGKCYLSFSGGKDSTALAYLAQYLGLEREQVMAMGDAENDLSMLEYAEHSVAMANASDEVKAACRYQTASNDDCGVAAMIDRVLAAKETI